MEEGEEEAEKRKRTTIFKAAHVTGSGQDRAPHRSA